MALEDHYTDQRTRIERAKYDDLKERTGLDYSGLLSLHMSAVKHVDKQTKYKSPIEVMIVNVRAVAWLTEMALDSLALGYLLSEDRYRVED